MKFFISESLWLTLLYVVFVFSTDRDRGVGEWGARQPDPRPPDTHPMLKDLKIVMKLGQHSLEKRN